jgi:phenylacetate-CoA ligase
VFKRFRFIYGYPNAIRELGELLAEQGARMPALRGIVCTAEVMRPEVRADIAAAFGDVPVHDQWGMNDGGLLATEGPERDGLHLFFHRAVLEIVDSEGRQITEVKKPGRALATCVANRATPFVRYETGDEVHWHSFEPSPSGIGLPRIGPVDGRTGDVIYLPSGRRIAMPGLTLVMRWLAGVRQYQFIQTAADAVTLRLELDDGATLNDDEVLAHVRAKIADEVQWTVVRGTPERTQNGKILIIRNDWLRNQGLTRPPHAARA